MSVCLYDTEPDVWMVSAWSHTTASFLDHFIQITLEDLSLLSATSDYWWCFQVSGDLCFSVQVTEVCAHPDLFTLEHEDLGEAFAAFLHGEGQQGVVGAAVQHSSGFLDETQGQRLQLLLYNRVD